MCVKRTVFLKKSIACRTAVTNGLLVCLFFKACLVRQQHRYNGLEEERAWGFPADLIPLRNMNDEVCQN